MKLIYVLSGSILLLMGAMILLGASMKMNIPETTLGLSLLMIVAGGFLVYKGGKNKELFICGYCSFKTPNKDTFDDHTITCEKYQVGMNNIGKKQNSSALEILKERYAKGEITKEEFDKMKEDLKD